MIIANHYIIREILYMLRTGDNAKIIEICEKFSKRYTNDKKFKNLCDALKDAVSSKDGKRIEKIKKDLKRLENIRGFETSGGTELWFKGRRPAGIHIVR